MSGKAPRFLHRALGDRALNRSILSERLKFSSYLVRYGMRRGWHGLTGPLIWLVRRPTRSPSRLLIAPQDIRTVDPTVAGDIYAGYLAFGGKVVNAHGRSPFDVEPPSRAWEETLQGFGWLRHLRAADTSLARANARALVEDWITHARQARRGTAWHPPVVARRLMSWLSQSPTILDGADGQLYRRLMRSLGRQAAFLQRRMANGLAGEGRLWAALALAELGICVEGLPALQKQGSRLLLDELTRQILGDGGHVSRNPGLVADVLLDLLPLRQAYAARGAPVPISLLNAIDRMMPMLRMFRHGDGSLALFNGMGVTQPEALATVLAYDDVHAMPVGNAPFSGYQRIEAGDAMLIADTGKPPPVVFSGRAHAGTLSFEFSVAEHRLIVNCGAPDRERRALWEAARSTAAHSTLVVGDTSSSRFASFRHVFHELDGTVAAGPRKVTVERSQDHDGSLLDATHDGYARHGVVHRRALRLDTAGTRLAGEDQLIAAEGHAAVPELLFALRFHLHPTVRATFAGDGGLVQLMLPQGQVWLFEAGGLPVDIEESIFFASAEGPRRTEQLVVQASTRDVQTIAWSLSRQFPQHPIDP